MSATPSPGEARRLRAIEQLDPLSLLGDTTLGRIVRLAATISGTASAGIHILDGTHQHRIASVGVPLEPWDRSDTFCRVVVDQGEALSTGDATADDRFAHSSFVRGEAPLRFYAAHPLRTATDDVVGTICVWDTDGRDDPTGGAKALADLAALVVEHLEMHRKVRAYAEQAMTDSLTGLPNRRMLLDTLDREFARRRRDGGGPASVTLFDLDGFKAINDTHGHDAGDAVLREIGRHIDAVVRRDEVCARLGGDEFALLQRADGAAAERAVRRVTEAITRPVSIADTTVRVGVSAGTTTVGDADTADLLLRRADLAMYEAKRGRRSA